MQELSVSIAWLQKISNWIHMPFDKVHSSHCLTSRHAVTARTYWSSTLANNLTFVLLFVFCIHFVHQHWAMFLDTAKLNDAKIFFYMQLWPGSLQPILPPIHWALKVLLLCTKEQKYETGNLKLRWITCGSLSHLSHPWKTSHLDMSKTEICRLQLQDAKRDEKLHTRSSSAFTMQYQR